MSLVKIPVINATVPAKFSNLGIIINQTGQEWWRAFNGNRSDYWNGVGVNCTNYLFIAFDDDYLLSSLLLMKSSILPHAPITINIYLDANASNFLQYFFFTPAVGVAQNFTRFFNQTLKSLPINQVLLGIVPDNPGYSLYLYELTFFGFRY